MESKYNLLTRLLNNIKNVVTPEGNVAGGALVVHDVEDTLDKTWQDIHDAMLSGGAVIQRNDYVFVITSVGLSGVSGKYMVATDSDSTYSTASASGYPSLDVFDDENQGNVY